VRDFTLETKVEHRALTPGTNVMRLVS